MTRIHCIHNTHLHSAIEACRNNNDNNICIRPRARCCKVVKWSGRECRAIRGKRRPASGCRNRSMMNGAQLLRRVRARMFVPPPMLQRVWTNGGPAVETLSTARRRGSGGVLCRKRRARGGMEGRWRLPSGCIGRARGGERSAVPGTSTNYNYRANKVALNSPHRLSARLAAAAAGPTDRPTNPPPDRHPAHVVLDIEAFNYDTRSPSGP